MPPHETAAEEFSKRLTLKILIIVIISDSLKLSKTGKNTASIISRHTIAVDPDLIRIGSKVLVQGLGVRYAEDVGGAIQKNRIDIFMDDHVTALSFGVKELEVQLLEQ